NSYARPSPRHDRAGPRGQTPVSSDPGVADPYLGGRRDWRYSLVVGPVPILAGSRRSAHPVVPINHHPIPPDRHLPLDHDSSRCPIDATDIPAWHAGRLPKTLSDGPGHGWTRIRRKRSLGPDGIAWRCLQVT